MSTPGKWITQLTALCSVRGYQFKSEGPGEPKKNARAYHMLNEGKEKLEGSPLPNPTADAKDLEDRGFATALAP